MQTPIELIEAAHAMMESDAKEMKKIADDQKKNAGIRTRRRR